MERSTIRLRARTAALLLAICTLHVSAAEWRVASLPLTYAEMNGVELAPDASRFGAQTLIVWQNANSVYPETHLVMGRIHGPEGLSAQFQIPRGTSPTVVAADNGWLLAYGIAHSRFNTHPFPNVAIRSVDTDGTLGPEVYLNTSTSNVNRIGNIVADQNGWMVGFSDGHARVAFLDEELVERASTLDLGSGSAPRLHRIGGAWWAFHTSDEGAVAVEILPDGTVGHRHVASGYRGVHVASDGSDTVVALEAPPTGDVPRTSLISMAGFSADAGFTDIRPAFEGRLFDLTVVGGEFVAIHSAEFPPVRLVISSVEPGGEVHVRSTLEQGGPFEAARIREGSEGPLLLVSALNGAGYPQEHGLYAVPFGIPPFGEPDWGEAELISISLLDPQSAPFIVSTGGHAVVFWNQRNEDGAFETWSRIVDPSGAPVSAAQRLRFGVSANVTAAWTGERIILSWTSGGGIYAAALHADGTAAGEPTLIGEGMSPALDAAGGAAFLVWEHAGDAPDWKASVRGTPLRSDASPHVPGGFDLLPSHSEDQGKPAIAALPSGFLLLWNSGTAMESVVISAEGAVRSSSRLQGSARERPVLATSSRSALAAWTEGLESTLYAFAQILPFERFRIEPDGLQPISIDEISPDRYAFTYSYGGRTWVREITMEGAFITGVSPPRILTRQEITREGVAIAGGAPLAVWQQGHEIFAGREDTGRRRGVSRR